MTPQLLYLIGQPGSGKTTLMAGLTEGLQREDHRMPFAHIVWGWDETVVELGARRDGGFGGTDALGMSVQPAVEAWLAETPTRYVMAEGDRLANSKFFRAAHAAGYQLTIVRLAVSAAVAEARRAARQAELGVQPQNNAWLKGRISKVRALAEAWPVVTLNADAPSPVLLDELRSLDHPLIARLGSQT